ncbi:MAG: Crp/Fnr family transcriptional regulator [Gammaproteobacteria bacterium]|nr:Crp/Fnr family transcriptional regulator [Gammaproteobacteria bacterium]
MHDLSRISIFSGLPLTELEAISKIAVEETVPAKTRLIHENDITDTCYFLLSGQVQIFLSSNDGKEFFLNTLGAGDYFGELALLSEEKRIASVTTIEKCSYLYIKRQDFKNILKNYPAIYPILVDNLVNLVRQVTGNVKMLALQDVYGRLRQLLMNESIIVSGIQKTKNKLTQQDIAKRIGSSREMVARILKELVLGEYISIDKKIIYIQKKLPEHF